MVSLGGEGITVKVEHGGNQVPVKVKTDEYEMRFRIRDLKGSDWEYDISRLEEVVRRFFEDGCVPN